MQMILYVSLLYSLFIDKQLTPPPKKWKNSQAKFLMFDVAGSDFINQYVMYMYLVSFVKWNNSIFFILEFTMWQRLITCPCNSNAFYM